MDHKIRYAYFCRTGLVRKNNEDNFLVDLQNLDQVNDGMEGVRTGIMQTGAEAIPVAAVFDGMGGEAAGETAAFLASEQMKQFCRMNAGKAPSMQLHEELCGLMNLSVLGYAREHRIGIMGSTVVYLIPGEDGIHCVNVGDSRIYRIFDDRIEQISTDHTLHGYFLRKSPLTQFIGLPDEDLLLVPSVKVVPYEPGCRFLLCSDGVTDMLDDAEIQKTVAGYEDMEECLRVLAEKVYANGARDNTTAVLCEVT